MLVDAIRSLFRAGRGEEAAGSAQEAAAGAGVEPVHLAACALLLDVAYADGEFSEPERAHLEAVLERHFALPPESGRRLIELAEAERAGSIDHFRFTSVLQRGYDLGQKMVLADGKVAEHEHYLARKIANLLELEPGYLAAAKAAAERDARAG